MFLLIGSILLVFFTTSNSLKYNFIPLHYIKEFNWYPSGEYCLSFWNVHFMWINGQIVWLENDNGFVQLMTNQSVTFTAQILKHACTNTNPESLNWCGHMPASIHLGDTIKVKPIGVGGTMRIHNLDKQLLLEAFTYENISNIDFELPMSAALTSDELCKHCRGTCERTCESLAAGNSITQCKTATIKRTSLAVTPVATVHSTQPLVTNEVTTMYQYITQHKKIEKTLMKQHVIKNVERVPFELMQHIVENRAKMIQSQLFLLCVLFVCSCH